MNKQEYNDIVRKALLESDFALFEKATIIYEEEHKDSLIAYIRGYLIERGNTFGRPQKYFELVKNKTRKDMFELIKKNNAIFEPFFTKKD